MVSTRAKLAPPGKNWSPTLLGMPRSVQVIQIRNSDSQSNSAPAMKNLADSPEPLLSKSRKIKTCALEKKISHLTTTFKTRAGKTGSLKLPRKPPKKTVKQSAHSSPELSASAAAAAAASSTNEPPSQVEGIVNDQMAALIRENVELRAQISIQATEHSQEMARMVSVITNSVTAALEAKFSERFDSLNATIASFSNSATPTSPLSCPICSYADIIESSPVPKKDRLHAAVGSPQPMDIVKPEAVKPLSRAQEIVANATLAQVRKSLRGPPPPRKGLRLVHIHGFCFNTGSPISLFAATMEVKFKFPRKHILNVSPISHNIAEVVIYEDTYEDLRAALKTPGCTLLLSNTLDARAPLSERISSEDARKFFHNRIDKEIARLKATKNPLLSRVTDLLVLYKTDGTRFLTQESRPTPIYMSAFLEIAVSSEIPPPAAMEL